MNLQEYIMFQFYIKCTNWYHSSSSWDCTKCYSVRVEMVFNIFLRFWTTKVLIKLWNQHGAVCCGFSFVTGFWTNKKYAFVQGMASSNETSFHIQTSGSLCYVQDSAVNKCAVSKLAGWCFEPSQPQRITSGLNTNFTLSPSYSFHVIIPQVRFLF